MRDQQEIIVRKGEVELLVWEFTEYDDGNPPVLKRHWFLAGSGLETDTFPEMLQRLGVPPPYPQDPPTPKDVDGTGVRIYVVPTGAAAEGSPGSESGVTQPVTPQPARSYTRPKWTDDEDVDEEERARDIQELRQRSDEELKAELKSCALQLGVTEEEYANLDPEAHDDAFNKAIARAEARILREDGPTPRCQHIKANGAPCGGYALKKKRFCFFHAQTADSLKKKKTKRPFHIPVLEDDLALQTAVTNICRGLANESLEPKRAATLLYGLQVASTVLKKKPAKKRSE